MREKAEIEKIVAEIAMRVDGNLFGVDPRAAKPKKRRKKSLRDMRCRHVFRGGERRGRRCLKKSRGPRFHYLCREHESFVR